MQVLWKGPIREDDRQSQIDVVENFTNQGVQAIVLAPLDSVAMLRPGARRGEGGDRRGGRR